MAIGNRFQQVNSGAFLATYRAIHGSSSGHEWVSKNKWGCNDSKAGNVPHSAFFPLRSSFLEELDNPFTGSGPVGCGEPCKRRLKPI